MSVHDFCSFSVWIVFYCNFTVEFQAFFHIFYTQVLCQICGFGIKSSLPLDLKNWFLKVLENFLKGKVLQFSVYVSPWSIFCWFLYKVWSRYFYLCIHSCSSIICGKGSLHWIVFEPLSTTIWAYLYCISRFCVLFIELCVYPSAKIAEWLPQVYNKSWNLVDWFLLFYSF